MIRLQFSANSGFISRAIRFMTFSDYGHVDFVLRDGRLLGSHIIGFRGVAIRPANYLTFTRTLIAEVDADDDVVVALAESQIGRPFDYTAFINYGFQRDWQEEDSWYCSELVAWAFKTGGVPLLNWNVETWRITPRDLLLSPMVHY